MKYGGGLMDKRLQRKPRTWHSIRLSKKVRTCLMCGKSFRSAGPHNRRCYRCNNLMEHAKESSYYQPTVYSIEGRKAIDFLDT